MSVWLVVLILGFIEGLTEFIPVSSTGHLLIAEHWLPRQSDLFNIVVQSGAVLAVLPLFTARLKMLAHWRDAKSQALIARIAVAFLITAVGGVILDRLGFKLPEEPAPVAWALIAGGVAFLGIEWWLRGRALRAEITWATAVAVGIAQLIAAVFPGTSRSGSTIVLALLLGTNRVVATEFSFLVGIPTLLAAAGLKIFKQLAGHDAHPLAENWSALLVGTVVAAIVSFVAVKWLLRYVQTHTFVGFGWYRIVLGIVLLVWFL
ncbi:MAG TPA: undecaprenyl-diphosphate phosphatase [Chthoniobacteraceae bacterium]|nr:undecaprenyl-diphosphate phosphatase [Chthoniobacteraceae bacterium]